VGVPCANYLTWWPASLELVGNGMWWHGSPPGLSVYHGIWMLWAGWGYGGVRVLPLLGGFSYKVYLQHLLRFYFRKHAFYFLPLVAILESSGNTFLKHTSFVSNYSYSINIGRLLFLGIFYLPSAFLLMLRKF
jgi:hypothetical protein